jgi:glycosyltransferase involved in cell wall biosynthesis
MNKRKKLHFAYSVPHSRLSKLKLGGEPLYRRYWMYLIRWPKPVRAPLSITYNILYHLKDEFDIHLYDIYETGSIELGKDDIFLGHIWPDFSTKEEGNSCWLEYDKDNLTNKMILRYPGDKRVFALSPFNLSVEQMGWASPLFKKVNRYIGICGDFWYDRLENSEFSFLKEKFSCLNMPINTEDFPPIKKQFNPKGKRKFLHIGRVSKEKNTEMLECLAENCPDFEGGYIGTGKIKGWTHIAEFAYLTPKFMASIADEYDFFINTSIFDAQATTIIESMAWGLVVACTPESGYQEDSIYQLSADNLQYNMEVVHMMQQAEEETLHAIVESNHQLLKNKFNWNIFINKLSNVLKNESI